MLTLERVGRRFPNGTEALRDASLHIAPGERIVLLGPSGCGKSTLLRLIAGLDRPDSGRLLWAEGPPAPGQIGYVFQDPTLLPWATATANVALPLRLRRTPAAQATPLALAALARVGLAGSAAARPRELSGGMRMRVSIARSLVLQPRLLLMDEPFAALDEFTRHTLQDDLLALCGQAGCSLVFVTHSIAEAAYLGQRILVMSARPGRIAAELAPGPLPADSRRTSPAYFAAIADATALLERTRQP